MKNINKIALLLSFLAMIILFSLIAMFGISKEFRYTLVAINPWNGVEGVMFTIQRFLSTGKALTYLITAILILFIWWRLYSLIVKYSPPKK